MPIIMCMHASYLRMIGGSDSMLCVCSFKSGSVILLTNSLPWSLRITVGQPYVQNTCVIQ